MNTKKEIVKFLEELAIGVQRKRDNYELRITPEKQAKNHVETNKFLTSQFHYTDGQLYEINYMLETIKRDRRKKL